MPTRFDFSIPSGDTRTQPIGIDPDEASALTASTILWQAFTQGHGVTSSTVPVLSKSNESPGGIVVPGSPVDTFDVELLPADTASLIGNYYYEARAIDGDGNVTTLVYGVLTVTQTEVAT